MSAPAVASVGVDRYRALASRAKLLSWLSLAVMSLEGIVALVAGIIAGSIALVGFGLDSAIEGFASVIIIWRFTGSRVMSETAEHRAQKLVAIQFFVLAPYVAVVLCAYLAGALLLGLAGNAIAGAGWLDPVVGLLIATVAVREGAEAWRGEGCCVADSALCGRTGSL